MYNFLFYVFSELILLFPNIAQKSHSPVEKTLERTMAIIRPSALKFFKGLKISAKKKFSSNFEYLDAIIKRVEDSGFEVPRTSEILLTKEEAEQFYADKKNEPHFQDLIREMTRYKKISNKQKTTVTSIRFFLVDLRWHYI